MLNVLSNGEQHNIDIVMMIKVQCALLELFVSTQGKIFLVSIVIFCLLDSMVVLQVKQFFGLRLQWFLFLHFSEGMLTWLVVGHLCQKGRVQKFNSLTSACVDYNQCKLHMHFKLIKINLSRSTCVSAISFNVSSLFQ